MTDPPCLALDFNYKLIHNIASLALKTNIINKKK